VFLCRWEGDGGLLAECRRAHTPPPPQNNRGYVADLQIVDEAAFVANSLLLECVLPVGLSSHVATVLATTPGREDSWFMRSIKLMRPDTGQPLMPVKRAYEPCEMHAKTRTPWVCTCTINQRASWKNPERERMWAPFWFANQDTFIAESLGVQVTASTQGFHPDAVARLRERPRYHIGQPVRFIFITVDPAEGGQDEFAIVASTDVNGKSFVVRLAGGRWLRMCFLSDLGMRATRGTLSARSNDSSR